jgi:GTP-binding protein HflX
VESVLRELEAQDTTQLLVRNKIDLLPPEQREALRDEPGVAHISAAEGVGLSSLLEAIDDALQEDPLHRVHLCVPQSEGKVLAQLEARARIYARSYGDGIVELEASAPESLLRHMRQYVVG